MYEQLLAWIATQPWAIDREKAQEILAFLALRSSGADDQHAERIHPSKERAVKESPGGIAIIPLHGIMAQRRLPGASTGGGVSTEEVGRALDQAAANPDIKAIILHVDSPGGSVAGTRELAAKVVSAKASKAVIAQVDSVAASAAYWVASQATEVVATPGGAVGSIGVITVHEDVSGMLEQRGIKNTIITAGKYKAEGHPFGPLDDSARAFLQARVDEAYGDFVDAVASGRGTKAANVRDGYGQGRMLSARSALGAGMVDRIATFDETLGRFLRSQPQPDRARRARAAAAIARS